MAEEIAEEAEDSSLSATEASPASEEEQKDEEKEEQRIPYSRFKEVEEEVKRLREEVNYYRSLQAQADTQTEEEPTSVADDDIDWENPKKSIESIVRTVIQQEVPKLTALEIQRTKAAEEALQLFPDLSNPDSNFFKQTAHHLQILGLDKHPEGVKLAASYVAATKMPETLSRMRAVAEQTRRTNLGFVEGSQPKGEEPEIDTFSDRDRRLLKAMGVTDKEIREIEKAKSRGGEGR